ncbi:hypothetical protein ACH5RR_031941 [Cinchona calisaya]|uniref:Uncharacterized protein n=1 Tax=Cinchona calisaya TaxID=153742 RepID=A0ABD2YKQ5_9GENT
MHDDGQESDDPELNRPTRGFLGNACRVALIQQSLVQLAHHPQPSPTRREKDVEKCFVVMSKIGVSMFDGGVDLDKTKSGLDRLRRFWNY